LVFFLLFARDAPRHSANRPYIVMIVVIWHHLPILSS
jgi:hypothetical protein